MVDVQLAHTSRYDVPDALMYPKIGIKHWYFYEPKDWNAPDNFTINYLIKSAGF